MIRKSLVVVLLCTLAVAGLAVAAIFVYDPVSSGSATGGSFGQHTVHVNQITFGPGTGTDTPVLACTTGTGASCTGGTPGTIAVSITNNDPNNPHAAIAPVVVLGSSGDCTPHLFVTTTSNLTESVQGGATLENASVTFVADPTTPITCDGASVTATITGTAA